MAQSDSWLPSLTSGRGGGEGGTAARAATELGAEGRSCADGDARAGLAGVSGFGADLKNFNIRLSSVRYARLKTTI